VGVLVPEHAETTTREARLTKLNRTRMVFEERFREAEGP
jgi:hypothetical protein